VFRRVWMIVGIAALSLVVLAACDDAADDEIAPVEGADDSLGLADDADPEGEDPDQGAARTDDGDAAGQTGGSPADDEAELLSDYVEVTLIDHEIELDIDSVGSGIVGFIISNEGDEEHGIAVVAANGNGDEEILGEMYVDPGEEEQLELELDAGEYIVYCPVGDHREEHGMETTLTVEEVIDDEDSEDAEAEEETEDETEDGDEEEEDDQ
jgi:hypothetical protein